VATLIASATLQINSFIGEPLYVVEDYVASGYVLGGELVAQDLDLATTLPISSSNITVSAVAFKPGTSSMPISSAVTTNAVATRIASVNTNITSTLTATGLDLDLATTLSIATANITVSAVRAVSFTATLPITSSINMGLNVFDIEVDPFNTFIVKQETRLNTIRAETRINKIKEETRLNTIQCETRVNKIKQETRVFELA
tara:strand:- start:853 stop:1455 length:603 start_codon:yes stop_codon:yes gene_type:complete